MLGFGGLSRHSTNAWLMASATSIYTPPVQAHQTFQTSLLQLGARMVLRSWKPPSAVVLALAMMLSACSSGTQSTPSPTGASPSTSPSTAASSAGSSSSGPPTEVSPTPTLTATSQEPTSSQQTSPRPPPAAAEVTDSLLLSAPVPELRGNPAGNLVDGVLPN